MEFISTFFWVVYFCIAAIISFYIPGRVLFGKKKDFSGLCLQTLSVTVGIVLFAWQGIIFGSFQIRWATYLYLLGFLIVYISKKYYPTKLSFHTKYIDWISGIIIAIGVFAQSISYVTMGWVTKQGVNIIAHNSNDHIWHAALVKELVKRFPPHEPSISGVILKDYHYWFNLVTADLIRIFHLPLFVTQFMGMYVLGSILFGLLIYIFVKHFSPSKTLLYLSLFFVFFSGNAAGWYMLGISHIFDWNVSSLIVDATKFMDSPAYGYAIIIGFTGIILLLQKKMSWVLLVVIALCFGSLIEFKVYVGIAFFAGFGCYSTYHLFRRNFRPAIAFVLAVILGLCIFLPGNSKDGGLAFIPFDIPRDFINQVKLGHVDWQLRWVIFNNHHNTLRIIQYGLMMSGVYFLVQYGILLFGLIPLKKTVLTYRSLLFLMYPTILVGVVMGLLFYQKVGGANIWEFFLTGVPFLELLLAANIFSLIQKRERWFQGAIVFVVVVFTIPQWIISTTGYIHDEFFVPFHGVSNTKLASFEYLNNNTPQNSIVLVMGQPENFSYASVENLFIDRDLYFSGLGVRQKNTPVILHREDVLHKIRTSSDTKQIADLLAHEHVNYLFVYNDVFPGIGGDGINLVKQFSNRVATIYQVKK